jgi:hypothetical protein
MALKFDMHIGLQNPCLAVLLLKEEISCEIIKRSDQETASCTNDVHK